MTEPTHKLEVKHRRLPHWRLDGSAYFVTWRLKQDIPPLNDNERAVVADTILYNKNTRYALFAWVVMDDHVHVVLKPNEGLELSKIIHTWKSFSSNQLQRKHGRKGQVWLIESWDRIVRDEDELLEKCQYILNNPLKRWPDIREYKWVGT